MRRAFASCFAFVSCLLAAASVARADQSAELARAGFAEGRDAMKRGDYAIACAKFEHSQQLDPSLGTLLNLGACEAQQGHLLRAKALLDQFLETAEPGDDRRANAQTLASELDVRLPRLVLRVEPTGLSEVRLRVDGQLQRFESETSLKVDPGRHEVEVLAAGYAKQQMTLELAESQFCERQVVLEPQRPVVAITPSVALAPQASAPQAAVPEAKPPLPRSFYIALGTGLAGALTIVGTGLMIADARSTVHAHCIDQSCDETGLAAGERGKTLVVVNTVAWPVALVGASLAAYFVLSRDHHTGSQYALGFTSTAARSALFFEGRW